MTVPYGKLHNDIDAADCCRSTSYPQIIPRCNRIGGFAYMAALMVLMRMSPATTRSSAAKQSAKFSV